MGSSLVSSEGESLEYAPQPATVRLGGSGIGDEEIHALVAVLSSKDRVDLLDLRGNSIGDVGARGLATLLRSSKVLAEVDLRDNCIGPTGLRILAEALEHNKRVRHVFVHGNGRIEALGTVSSSSSTAGGEDESHIDDDDAVIDTVLVVNAGSQKDSSSSSSHSGGKRSGKMLELAPLPPRSMLTPGNNRGGAEGGAEEGTDGHPKYYTHRQEKEKLDAIDANNAMKRGKEQLDTPLLRKIRNLEKNLGPSANGPPENDAVAEINAIVEAEKWSNRAVEQESTGGLEGVPDSWIGTETAPAAYASPLTRRIRALEERLAIADMGEDGVVAPMPTDDVVMGLTSEASSSKGNGGVRSRSGGSSGGGGGRLSKAAQLGGGEDAAGGRLHGGRERRPPLSSSTDGLLRPRAKSAVGGKRKQQSPGGPMPSPAWQGNSGPSLLGQALVHKETSLNQSATRDANMARVQQRDRPATANSPIVGRSMSVRRAGAARVRSDQRATKDMGSDMSSAERRVGQERRRKTKE
jgi:hypothetical protein